MHVKESLLYKLENNFYSLMELLKQRCTCGASFKSGYLLYCHLEICWYSSEELKDEDISAFSTMCSLSDRRREYKQYSRISFRSYVEFNDGSTKPLM